MNNDKKIHLDSDDYNVVDLKSEAVIFTKTLKKFIETTLYRLVPKIEDFSFSIAKKNQAFIYTITKEATG